MYLIRLPSGREASFETLTELVGAIQRGDVPRDAVIFHRRTNQWLPIERHPHFQEQPPGSEPETPAPFEPVAPTPIAPPVHAAAPATPRAHEPPAAVRQPPASRELDHTARPRQSSYRGRTALIAAAIVILGGAAGIAIGWKLRPGEATARGDAFRYQPAPAPSSLIRPDPTPPLPVERRAVARPPARRDPLAPVTAAQLGDRRSAAFTSSREQLARELDAVGLPQVFGVRSLATPEGARSARRVVAAALNVIGQFHRREIIMDQAYRDTAAFQTTRAGWSAEERTNWTERASLREPYSAADLAESLLADADSLLAILAANPFTVRGDTLDFGEAGVGASYRAQRSRITERSGPPIGDPDRRPTLAHVRRSVDPAQLPAGAP